MWIDRPRAGLFSLIVSMASLSCSSPCETGKPIAGSPADVATKVGAHEGFDVREGASCTGSSNAYALLGRGSRWYRDADPQSSSRADAVRELASQVVTPRLAGITSIVSVGMGNACDTLGVFVGLSDWREVDEVISRLGALLREQDLREQVSIKVMAPPQATQTCPGS